MKSQVQELVYILANRDRTVPVAEIASELACTPRYARMLLDEAEAQAEAHGYRLVREFRQGVSIEITNPRLFWNETDDAPDLAASVARALLEADGYLRIEDLCKWFYVSTSTMEAALAQARELLAEYDLGVEGRQKRGLIVDGTEVNRRIAYAHLARAERGLADDAVIIQWILADTLDRHGYELSDIGFDNLVYHLAVAVGRIGRSQTVGEGVDLGGGHPLQREIAADLARQLEERFGVAFPPNERDYIVLHLLGKELMGEGSEMDPAVADLSRAMLERIREHGGPDLTGDADLMLSLCLHLQPLVWRLSYGMEQDNPLMGDIKRDMAEGYDLALVAREVIAERCGRLMSDAETGYLALHFSLALERRREGALRSPRVLVACSTGRGTARMLAHLLHERFDLDESAMVLTSVKGLAEHDLRRFDCVVSTVPIPQELPVPVLVMSVRARDLSSERARDFFAERRRDLMLSEGGPLAERWFAVEDLATRDEVLQCIAKRLRLLFPSGADLLGALREREEMSSTEMGNLCATPHPLDLTPASPALLAIVLERPITWHDERVQLVVCPVLDDDSFELVDAIAALVSDRALVQRVIAERSFATFRACLREAS